MKISPIVFLASLPIAAIATTTISSCAQDSPPMDSSPIEVSQVSESSWRQMNSAEEAETWDYILNSPLAIAALNQLAIEGFISPICKKTFYLNEEFGGFQSLLRVKCRDPQGLMRPYDEMRVIFNRFEMSIESFDIERVYSDSTPEIRLPE